MANKYSHYCVAKRRCREKAKILGPCPPLNSEPDIACRAWTRRWHPGWLWYGFLIVSLHSLLCHQSLMSLLKLVGLLAAVSVVVIQSLPSLDDVPVDKFCRQSSTPLTFCRRLSTSLGRSPPCSQSPWLISTDCHQLRRTVNHKDFVVV